MDTQKFDFLVAMKKGQQSCFIKAEAEPQPYLTLR